MSKNKTIELILASFLDDDIIPYYNKDLPILDKFNECQIFRYSVAADWEATSDKTSYQ